MEEKKKEEEEGRKKREREKKKERERKKDFKGCSQEAETTGFGDELSWTKGMSNSFQQ